MNFKLTNCVALQTHDPEKARSFYTEVMGMSFDQKEDEHPYAKCGQLNLFVGKEVNYTGPVLDFVVDNVDEAKEHLLKNGCEVLKWNDTCKYLRDPFGMCFNLYAKS